MNHNGEPTSQGSLLRGPWSLAVQLVGTFGLAVFLVLYYVLVMQPKAQADYDRLRGSVDALLRVVEGGQTLVTQEQGDRLEELYILAVAPELAKRMERALPQSAISAARAGTLEEELQSSLEDVLFVRTRLLRGLSLRDGGDVSQALTSKIREREIPQLLAQRAIVEWPYGSREELFDMCKESLYFAFRKTPLLK